MQQWRPDARQRAAVPSSVTDAIIYLVPVVDPRPPGCGILPFSFVLRPSRRPVIMTTFNF